MTTTGRGLAAPSWAGGRVAGRVAQGAAVIGFVFGLGILLGLGIDGSGGTGGTDALAYWHAGRAVVDGSPLYGQDAGTTSAYLYTPLFAQVTMPLTLLPQPAFVWFWRLLEVGCLRIAIGSWTRAGIAILVFPPVIIELAYANVNLMIAAVCVLVMRRTVGVWGVPIVVKAAAAPLVLLAFIADRRTFLWSAAITAGVVAASAVIAPDLWSSYLAFLTTAREPSWWTNLAYGFPLAPRLALAAVLGLAAIKWVRLAPIAVFVGLPIVWLTSASILVATVVPLPRQMQRADPYERRVT